MFLFTMVNIVPLDTIKKRYEDAASRAGTPYREGVERNTDWKARAASPEAESNYQARMQEVLANSLRQKGIEKTSQEEWKSRAATKGAAQIGGAMRASSDKQSKGFSPYHSALAGLTLPARGPRDGSNLKRVEQVMNAMIAKRKEIKGA